VNTIHGINLKICNFWDIPQRSPMEVTWRFAVTCCLHIQGLSVSQARNQHATRSKLIEWICFSEIPIDFQRTTRRYIPEGATRHNHSCENLKSYTELICWPWSWRRYEWDLRFSLWSSRIGCGVKRWSNPSTWLIKDFALKKYGGVEA
jgi:hypothetical protein